MEWNQIKGVVLQRLPEFMREGRRNLNRDRIKYVFREGTRQFVRTDLRWSYLVIGGMVAAGVLVNVFLPHGWTVWPVVMGAGIMLMIHEAADRNLQGVPPLHVYGFFISAMVVWLGLIAILSAFNPVILLIGLIVLGYYCTLGYIKQLERRKLIARRRLAQQCVHCGRPADYELALCMHCGREPDPDDAQLKRVAHQPKTATDKARARENLTPKPPTESAAKKEQALIQRRRTKRPR